MRQGATRESDEVRLTVATSLGSLQSEPFIRRLLSLLRDVAPGYLPDSFQGFFVDQHYRISKSQVRSLDANAIPMLVHELETPRLGDVKLTRGKPPTTTLVLPTRVRRGIPQYNVHLSIRRNLVRTPDERQRFLLLAQRLFVTCEGFFGEFGTFRHMKTKPVEGAPGMYDLVVTNLARGLPPPDWGLLLGPDYAGLIGVDRIKRAPCEIVREFDSGSFMLLLAEDFETLDANESLLEEARDRLVEHFGPEYFSYAKGSKSKVVLPHFARWKTE